MLVISLCAQRSRAGCLGRIVKQSEEKEVSDKRTARGVALLYRIGFKKCDESLSILKEISDECGDDPLCDKDVVIYEHIRAKACSRVWKVEEEKQSVNRETIESLAACSEKDAFAMEALARCYDKGYGVLKDEKKAIELYERAVELGNARAMYNLGVCYKYGEGVPKDMNKAIELYERAAALGNANAMNGLGVCYK